MNYFIGIGCILLGAALVVKAEWFYQNFGANAWAEEKFGTSGGTRSLIKILGIIAIFLGFIIVTNMWQGFLAGTIGRIFIFK